MDRRGFLHTSLIYIHIGYVGIRIETYIDIYIYTNICIEICNGFGPCKPQQFSSLVLFVLLSFFVACIAMTSASACYHCSAMDFDEAESPLEGEYPDWLEPARQRALLDLQEVKHQFVHMRLAASWLDAWPMNIDVNKGLQISCENGDWHGRALYHKDDEGLGSWTLTFHYEANVSLMKTNRYRQVLGTSTYLCVDSRSSNQFNCMLVAKNE